MKAGLNNKYAGWLETNRRRIEARTAFLAKLPQGLAHSRPRSMHNLRVIRRGDLLDLLFYGDDSHEIISRSDVNDPLNLVGIYTQAMMLTLLWRSEPKRVYVLGFGAGRLPTVLHHFFPEVMIECTELDPEVVEVAEKFFGVILDRRLKVAIEDGRQYLEKSRPSLKYDIILIDAFRGVGSGPYFLATQNFYDICQRRLVPGGVVSVNLLWGDTLIKEKIATFAASFRNVYEVQVPRASVLFGMDKTPETLTEIVARAEEVLNRHGFVFPFLEHAAKLRQIVEDGRITASVSQARILKDNDPSVKLPLLESAYTNARRNEPCPCGSGKKFKKCHGAQAPDQLEKASEPASRTVR